jgi:hypothetical protein
MMAATAKYRDDIAGAITTGGTSTAYTVTSYQVFDTLAHMNGALIAFTPHVTNGATVTLNVDSLGAKPLRPAPSVELQTNVLIAGTPYIWRPTAIQTRLGIFTGSAGTPTAFHLRAGWIFGGDGTQQRVCIPGGAGDQPHDLRDIVFDHVHHLRRGRWQHDVQSAGQNRAGLRDERGVGNAADFNLFRRQLYHDGRCWWSGIGDGCYREPPAIYADRNSFDHYSGFLLRCWRRNIQLCRLRRE